MKTIMCSEDIKRYLFYVLICVIVFIVCMAVVYGVVYSYVINSDESLFGNKFYEQIDFTQEEIGIAADELGVQDDIIKPRSLLVAFMDDYHPIKLLFSVKEGREGEFEAYTDTYYEQVKASKYAEGIFYQGQEYRKKYIYNLVSYWGDAFVLPEIGIEAYESSQGEMLYLWWNANCNDEPLLRMSQKKGRSERITPEQAEGRKYPLQDY